MRKKLRIVQVAPLHETVPPQKYGGTERIVCNLVKYLAAQDHEVTLVCAGTPPENMPANVRVITIFKKTIREIVKDNNVTLELLAPSLTAIGTTKTALALQKQPFDIIHSHISWHLNPYKPLFKGVLITTLHGPLGSNDRAKQRYLYGLYKHDNFISISDNQRADLAVNFVATIHHGIDTTEFTFNNTPDDYLVWLGRFSPEKGPIEAIITTQKAGKKLIMAGKVDDVDKTFFEKKVKPLIDGRHIQYIGEIDSAEKMKLLKNARALLGLIQWDEPFGLFVIESLACGTPVIAYPRGALPEIIEESKTGFFVKTVDAAVEAIKKIPAIDRKACRRAVEQNFSLEKMGSQYEEVYYKLLEKKSTDSL